MSSSNLSCPTLKKGVVDQKRKYHFKLFNYVLKLMHTGCQWYNLPIALNSYGKPEIHYTTIFKAFKYWTKAGSVAELFKAKLLDVSVIHGDGTTTSAKRGR